jgi:dipeptidase
VVIGNEALFTREKPLKTGLTGMDLVRLALERSRTAAEARETIISLLEEHGQGGDCGYRRRFRYMNSFLIADPGEAFVLETVRKWWAWKKVSTVWTISNIASLENDFDACSPGLIDNALERGWCKDWRKFSLRKCYCEPVVTALAAGARRQARSAALCAKTPGKLTAADMMAILRDHGGDEFYEASSGGTSICMHAADALVRRSQTVGSMVSVLGTGKKLHFATGSSNPCLSPFFPVFGSDADLPSGYGPGSDHPSRTAWWWEAEILHRRAQDRFVPVSRIMARDLASYENEMLESVGKSGVDRQSMDLWFERARGAAFGLAGRLETLPARRPPLFYRLYWRRINSQDGI